MSTQSFVQPSRERVGKVGLAVRICLLMALLILFNIYPDKVGAYRTALDSSSFTPLLGRGFYAALPWLNVWWLAALALATVLIVVGQWTRELRLADWVVDVFGIVVLWRLLTGAPVLLPIPDWPASIWTPNTLVRILLGLALLGRVVGALRDLGHLLPAWLPELRREVGS